VLGRAEAAKAEVVAEVRAEVVAEVRAEAVAADKVAEDRDRDRVAAAEAAEASGRAATVCVPAAERRHLTRRAIPAMR
jgi:hypothetical protein